MGTHKCHLNVAAAHIRGMQHATGEENQAACAVATYSLPLI